MRCTNKPTQFGYLGATVCENADHTADIHRRGLLANLRFRRSSLPLYDQLTAPLRLKVRVLKAEVMETMLCGCVTWSPTLWPISPYYGHSSSPIAPPLHRMAEKTSRQLPYAFIRKLTGQYCLSVHWPILSAVCQNGETTVRNRRIFFAGFVARMGNETTRTSHVSGTGGGKGLLGGQEQDWTGCLERDISLFHMPTIEK